jgi:rhodanese-related sulfurtransferase
MKKRGILVAGLLLLALAGYSQVKSGAFRLMLKNLLRHSVPEIDVRTAARDTSSIFFFDAREPREFNVSHLKGAYPVGYDSFSVKQLPPLDKNSRIVVYCSVGYRSEKVSEQLLAAGFTRVANLYGGIFEWVNQGFPVYNENGPTKQVHAFDKKWGVWLTQGEKVF